MAEATLLEPELQQLECHFTWELKKEDINITDVLNRLEQHEELGLGGKAGLAQTYNSLAFVKYLLGSPTAGIGLVHKSMELTREWREDKCDKWLIVTYGNLAWLHHHMKAYSECESYLQKLREIGEKFPTDSPSTLHHEVLGEKAWAFFKFSRKYYERAEECFKKALELEPRDPQWNTGYAFVLHRTELYGSVSSPENSPCVKQLHQAIDADPENDELKALLALRLCTFEQYDEAESLVEKAVEGSPSAPNVIRHVGKYLRTYGCVDRSISLLKRVLESSPNSGFLHHQLALCYRKKKISLQKAVHQESPSAASEVEIQRLRQQCIYHLEKAATLKSCFINAMIELAVQYGEDNQLDRAEEMFQGTLQMAKEKNEFLQQVYVYYGEFQQYRKRCFPLALSYYKECLKIDHDSVDGKRSAINLTKIADRSLLRDPQDAKAWGIRGFVYKEKGENREALKCYEKALQFNGNDEYLSALCELRLTL
ncbi:interferon-induced protein with tetratricopeptide repeats 5-like [Salminus brasiliensis]|uniref:interferon-induced protein with tetratricopeptide repeats 5-like n=1 Tax=Salminus brasiliensis TaxID=930266 RepID=UPI003B8387E9